MAKISGALEDRLRSAAPGELVDVVVEVTEQNPSSLPRERSERYAALEQHFGSSTEDVRQLIHGLGGQVLASSWLSRAIKVRIPVESIERLRSVDRVELIDVVRHITRG